MRKGNRISLEQLNTLIILAVMFLCALDFLNRHQILLYVAFGLFIATPHRKLRFDFKFLLLSLFSFSMILFNPNFQSSITDMLKAFNYPLCYLLGTSMFIPTTEKTNDIPNAEKGTKLVIYVIAIGTFVHYFLNMLVNIGRTDREVIEFWSKKEVSATSQAAFACFIIGVIAATIFSTTNKTKKIVALVSLIIVVVFNLVLAGRTLFVLLIIALLIAYLYKNYVDKTSVFKALIILVLSVVLFAVLYELNVLNVKTMFENSNFYDRFYGGEYTQDIEEDSRMEHKMYYLTHFGDYLFGGSHLRAEYGHSAHDLYLDTYDESGIFALIFIVIYIASSLIGLVKCLKDELITTETKQLVLCVYLLVNIMFFMEPIIRGIPWLLFLYCFADGALSYMRNHSEKISV